MRKAFKDFCIIVGCSLVFGTMLFLMAVGPVAHKPKVVELNCTCKPIAE